MANTKIQIKRSTTTAIPTGGSLSAAEPAYSYNSNKLFLGDSAGTGVIAIGGQFYVDQQNTIFAQANAAFNAANSGTAGSNAYAVLVGAASNTWANTVGTAGNNYTNSVGLASNNYATTMDTAGNNYTVTVGASSNAWANAVGTAGNNYTNSVGVAGNNYTNSVGVAGNNYKIGRAHV